MFQKNCIDDYSKRMTEHIVDTNAEFLVVWRGFKMSLEGGSDRQQAGFLIVAAVRKQTYQLCYLQNRNLINLPLNSLTPNFVASFVF